MRQKEDERMTIREAIEQAHCRRGKAAGTTKDGAYWLACEPIMIRRAGGDGIGNNDADRTNYLELRHYRDGAARARVHVDAYHQNGGRGGGGDWWTNADCVLDATSAEACIVALKGLRCGEERVVYSDWYEDDLTKALGALGVLAHEAAPDEVPA
jgi:hypothetical protein